MPSSVLPGAKQKPRSMQLPAGPCRARARALARRACHTRAASKNKTAQEQVNGASEASSESKMGLGAGLGDLGPIGMTVGGGESLRDKSGVSMGPISLSFDGSDTEGDMTDDELKTMVQDEKKEYKSISGMSTAEWRAKYEPSGAVDLWVEEEFNSGSRLVGGRVVHKGGKYGQGSGEGETLGFAPVHHVTIHDRRNDQVVDVDIPQDRYILWEAEDEGLQLPYACRMGCCTACAVKVREGSVWQPEALGISKGLKEKGYALMCVGYPEADTVLETVEEDELYQKQFGESFAECATDKRSIFIDRDDFALELAEMDE